MVSSEDPLTSICRFLLTANAQTGPSWPLNSPFSLKLCESTSVSVAPDQSQLPAPTRPSHWRRRIKYAKNAEGKSEGHTPSGGGADRPSTAGGMTVLCEGGRSTVGPIGRMFVRWPSVSRWITES
jgi:hypothetical protein